MRITETRLCAAESPLLRKAYGGFGERWLETQVKLCAGRRLYFFSMFNQVHEDGVWQVRELAGESSE